MTTARPLILAAHGTRAQSGRVALTEVLEAVRRRLPGVDVRLAYVDVLEPTVHDALVAAGDAVIVPYLLTAGYHVEVDLPEAVTLAGHGTVTSPLAPSEGVEAALADLLTRAGGTEAGSHVLLVGAGSTRPVVHEVLTGTAARLSERIGLPVTVGALTGGAPIAEQVAAVRASGPSSVAIASALLLPGYFHRQLLSAGADVVSEPLVDHPRIVDELVARYDAVRGVGP